jgi:hypothetical protein
MVLAQGYCQMHDSFEISRLKGPHACQNPLILQHHCLIDYDLIDEVMLIIVKANISMNVANIQASKRIDYEHDVSYYKTRVAK